MRPIKLRAIKRSIKHFCNFYLGAKPVKPRRKPSIDQSLEGYHVDRSIETVIALLSSYLQDFPEHDQGDIRVWEANDILNTLQAHKKKVKP